ncbi:MAG: hypothetical protein AB7O43_14870 [Hyphomicrobiaceae bacterium]
MDTSGGLKVRSHPQISANDLALYMESSESTKLGIIRRNKYPSKHVNPRYQDAKRRLTAFLADDVRDKTKLATAIEYFRQLADDSSVAPSKREDARTSAHAVEAFFTAYNTLALARLTFRIPQERLGPLIIAGVRVPTTLDLYSVLPVKGVEQYGGVILRLTMAEDGDAAKSKREAIGHYAATLAYLQMSDKKPFDTEPLPRICLQIDVQHQMKCEARAGSRRIKDLTSACTFIASVWASV